MLIICKTQVEDQLGEINHQLTDKENEFQQLQGDYWQTKAELSESANQIAALEGALGQARQELTDCDQQIQRLQEDLQAVQSHDAGNILQAVIGLLVLSNINVWRTIVIAMVSSSSSLLSLSSEA